MNLKNICYCGHLKIEHEITGDWFVLGVKNYFYTCKGTLEKQNKDSGKIKNISCKCDSYSETPFQIKEKKK